MENFNFILFLVILLTPLTSAEEAVLTCNLDDDVNRSKRSVLIKQEAEYEVVVLGCDFLASNPDKPDCLSRHNFTLQELLEDRVEVRAPREKLEGRVFKCELLPPPEHGASVTDCNWVEEKSTTTTIPVTPNTTTEDTVKTEPLTAGSYYSTCEDRMNAVILALVLLVLMLLLMIIVLPILVFLRPEKFMFIIRRLTRLDLQQRAEEKPLRLAGPPGGHQSNSPPSSPVKGGELV